MGVGRTISNKKTIAWEKRAEQKYVQLCKCHFREARGQKQEGRVGEGEREKVPNQEILRNVTYEYD